MANQKNFSATKMVIPCRISFANIWEPKAINGGDEKLLKSKASFCGFVTAACSPAVASANAQSDRDAAVHEGLARLQIAAASSACCC